MVNTDAFDIAQSRCLIGTVVFLSPLLPNHSFLATKPEYERPLVLNVYSTAVVPARPCTLRPATATQTASWY